MAHEMEQLLGIPKAPSWARTLERPLVRDLELQLVPQWVPKTVHVSELQLEPRSVHQLAQKLVQSLAHESGTQKEPRLAHRSVQLWVQTTETTLGLV